MTGGLPYGPAGRRTLADCAWLREPALVRVFAALIADDRATTARAVGGCVRDGLLGLPVHDVDIATPLAPDIVSARAKAAGLRVVPTGIDHGTVTVLSEGHRFEVTTLRHDVSTDGRRATIAFTDDWAADAARRDFTINALYADPDGTVHDPLGQGLADLAAGRVRFIGVADDRLAEDHLRLLRYLRFHARYDRGEADPEAIAACRRAAPSVARLSGERLWQELGRILAGPRRPMVWSLARDHRLLTAVLPSLADPVALARLDAAAPWVAQDDPVIRLAAGLPALTPADWSALAQRLRLPLAVRDRLVKLPNHQAMIGTERHPGTVRRVVWSMGRQGALDAVAWRLATQDHTQDLRLLIDLAEWPWPILPLTGADLVAAGVPPGPQIGLGLAQARTAWLASDFRLDPQACRAIALAGWDRGGQPQPQ